PPPFPSPTLFRSADARPSSGGEAGGPAGRPDDVPRAARPRAALAAAGWREGAPPALRARGALLARARGARRLHVEWRGGGAGLGDEVVLVVAEIARGAAVAHLD